MPPGALLNPCPTFEMIRMQNEGLGGACPGGKRGLSATIPVVFITSDDPVRLGLVASLAQPGSNLTGINFFRVDGEAAQWHAQGPPVHSHYGETELMPTGRVKFFNADRGYGFIAPDGGGSDVFVHVHEVESAGMKTLIKGQLITYNTAPARDGRLKAVNLRLLSQ
jgi:cold shock protein